jgi:CRISPR-associated protein Csh1
MIEAIREIGEYTNKCSGEFDLLENLSKKIPFEKKNKNRESVKQHIVIFNFDLNNQKIECHLEQVKEDSGKKFLWLGNNSGNKPQIFFTSDSFSFIFGTSIVNIKERVDLSLGSELDKIKTLFFDNDNGHSRIKYDKFACLDDVTLKQFEEKITKSKSNLETDLSKSRAKAVSKKYLDELNKMVLNSLNPSIRADEVAVYTLALNGTPLVNHEEYRKMIYYEKLGCLFDPKNKTYKNNFALQGNCSLCDKKKLPTSSTATNLSFKFYMTDKLGFSSDLDGKFTKNFNICKTCYADLLAGERFIDNNLKTYLGGISCYVIPSILFKNPKLDYVRFSEYITHKNNALSNLITLPEFEKELKEFREFEDEKNSFVINYLFYRKSKGKSDFKILNLIKDVPPSRLDKIFSVECEISNIVKERYSDQWSFQINLRSISKIIPLGLPDKKNNKVPLYSSYLELLDSIFSNKRIDYRQLITQFSETLQIVYFKRAGFTVTSKVDLTLEKFQSYFILKILQMNFALSFFKRLNLLKGMHMCGASKIESIPEDITQFWDVIGTYTDHQKTLFLLGFLMGDIGNKQFKAGHKNKPILNKINFDGMNLQAIMRLTNEVFEKMLQYKILKYNESLFYQFKKMIDHYSQNWNLTNQENVFYILSGYSFATYQVISKGEEEIPKKEEEMEDEGGDEDE